MRRLLPLLAAALAVALAATPPSARAAAPAIDARLWPSSFEAAPGAVLILELMLKNTGDRKASYVVAELPYVRDEMTAFRSEFDADDMWISSASDGKLKVEFGSLRGGEQRRARIYFRISDQLPAGFRIVTRLKTRWQGADASGSGQSNQVAVTIGGQPAEPRATIAPAEGPNGTQFRVQASGYFPKETLFLWLNMPDATVRPIDVRVDADGGGAAGVDLRLSDLPAGSYGLVVYGHTSQIARVVTVTLTR